MAKTFDYKNARERTADYISVAEGIAQSYPDPLLPGIDSTGHGVQKDAIQNGWDARTSSRSTMNFRFELVKTAKGLFLMMEDDGRGLTGKVWSRDKLNALDAKGEDLPPDERWGRFESFGFRTKAGGGIGSRGQGKFLFIHASASHDILYETVLGDGTYRLGATMASGVGCPMQDWKGKKAKEQLTWRTGLVPLTHRGTRIVICDVVDEVTEAVRNGAFQAAIEETWWRNIQKKKAVIEVCHNGTSVQAGVPSIYPLPTKESKGNLKHKGGDIKVWKPDLKKLTLPDGGKFKKFEMCYRNDVSVPEHLRGIAILHYGMKVATVEPQYPATEINEGLYGYVEVDAKVDEQLRQRENQKPHHYDLIWTRLLPRTIRQVIRDQIDEFGRAKLGQGASNKQKLQQLQADAERLALQQLLAACKDLDLDLTSVGNTGGGGGGGGHPTKPYGVTIANFTWPTPGSRRIEHGETVDFDLVIFNTTKTDFGGCTLKAHLFRAQGGHSVHAFSQRKVQLAPGTKQTQSGHHSVQLTKSQFPSGEYVLKAVLIDKNGYEVDSQAKHMYVDMDPPLHSPFELVGENWAGSKDWENVSHTVAYTDPRVIYNMNHPRYIDAEATAVTSDLGLYLYGVLVSASIQLALYQARKGGFPSIFQQSKIASSEQFDIVEDANRVHGLLMAHWSG